MSQNKYSLYDVLQVEPGASTAAIKVGRCSISTHSFVWHDNASAGLVLASGATASVLLQVTLWMFLQGAYRAAALLHHPDKAGRGQDTAFQRLQAAWEVRAVHHASAWLAALHLLPSVQIPQVFTSCNYAL